MFCPRNLGQVAGFHVGSEVACRRGEARSPLIIASNRRATRFSTSVALLTSTPYLPKIDEAQTLIGKWLWWIERFQECLSDMVVVASNASACRHAVSNAWPVPHTLCVGVRVCANGHAHSCTHTSQKQTLHNSTRSLPPRVENNNSVREWLSAPLSIDRATPLEIPSLAKGFVEWMLLHASAFNASTVFGRWQTASYRWSCQDSEFRTSVRY